MERSTTILPAPRIVLAWTAPLLPGSPALCFPSGYVGVSLAGIPTKTSKTLAGKIGGNPLWIPAQELGHLLPASFIPAVLRLLRRLCCHLLPASFIPAVMLFMRRLCCFLLLGVRASWIPASWIPASWSLS